MILYASQRANAEALAKHLLNDEENDHVEVYEVRGFIAEDLMGALEEAAAISKGTRCRQYLFSVSLNPPEYADVPIEDFEAAIEEIEQRLKLIDQPRIIVFHEKNGRRHCHVIWSRIQYSPHTHNLTAIRMSHFKLKLMTISRCLFLKHGWPLPKGMRRSKDRSPFHLTREEYRQAKRLAQDAKTMKAILKGAWEQSDSKAAFAGALQEHGFLLARGDRRGYVAVDITGGVYSLTRWLDVGTRDLKARLGKVTELPSMEDAKTYLDSRMTENVKSYLEEPRKRAKQTRKPVIQEIRSLVVVQRQERQELLLKQDARWVQETKGRSSRFYRGLSGIWQRAAGAYAKVKALNETETKAGLERNRKELHQLVRQHLLERQKLQKTVNFYKEEERLEALRIRKEMAQYIKTETTPPIPPARAAVDISALTEKLHVLESKIATFTGDLATLQASLEDNSLSDDMRARLRQIIERSLEKLHIKTVEERQQQISYQEKKEREYRQMQTDLNASIREHAALQVKIEQEGQRQKVEYGFALTIRSMRYSLNGLPAWEVKVMPPPPEKRLDEPALIKSLRKYNMAGLENIVLKSPANASNPKDRPPIDPPMATVQLRTSVLEVREMLIRAGAMPKDGGIKPAMTPLSSLSGAVINVNPTKGGNSV